MGWGSREKLKTGTIGHRHSDCLLLPEDWIRWTFFPPKTEGWIQFHTFGVFSLIGQRDVGQLLREIQPATER